ncbi:unnamed protein product [Fructobacillus tropaeoli]|nr:unnamed protein product [Fructobacillus tropaeoli]
MELTKEEYEVLQGITAIISTMPIDDESVEEVE